MCKFYLIYNSNKIEVYEPTGWDNVDFVLKRGESHGMSAEFTETELKFYDPNAIQILEQAYVNDLDSIITLTCENDGVEEYRGVIDFENYSKTLEDGYWCISIKVSDIGVQVVFNNRIKQKVDIDSATSFDGVAMPNYAMLRKIITLPSKEILSTASIANQPGSIEYPSTGDYAHPATPLYYLQYKMDINDQELSSVYTVDNKVRDYNSRNEVFNNIFFRYFPEDGISINDARININIDVVLRLIGSVNNARQMKVVNFYLTKNNTVIYSKSVYNGALTNTVNVNIDAEITTSLNNQDALCYYFYIDIDVDYLRYLNFQVNINTSQIKVSALNKYEDTTAKVSFVHEVLSCLAESITNRQLTVKSDYYGRTDSNVNAVSVNGKGSFRVLTTGLRIRNVLDSVGSETLFTTSFDDVLKSLKCIDNIGFGISTENGIKYLRVEPYEWFYKDNVVFRINNPSQISRRLNANELCSRLKIGYKKYEVEDTNGLDAFHTEREYRTRLKLTDKQIEMLCEFIADGYAIEYTRRMAVKKDTKDWRYDNNTFIICVMLRKINSVGEYLVDQSINDSAGTVISPATIYNTRISPARMAKRWLNKITQFGKGNFENLIFSAGTGNIKARGYASVGYSVGDRQYIYADTDYASYTENQNFVGDGSILLMPETIEIDSYPITYAEYQVIKNNPYGKILVDFDNNVVECFISEFKYKKQKNEGSFVLIPKKV